MKRKLKNDRKIKIGKRDTGGQTERDRETKREK